MIVSTVVWTPASGDMRNWIYEQCLIGRVHAGSVVEIESGKIEAITKDYLFVSGFAFARCNFVVALANSYLQPGW